MVHTPHRSALSLQNRLGRELDEVVRQGLIAPAEDHSDWMNSLIRDKPNGLFRVYLYKTSTNPSQRK